MTQTNFLIKTKRLGFRLLKSEDIDYLSELNADPDVRHFFPGDTMNREQTADRINQLLKYYKENSLPCFLMFLLESNEFVGRCGFGLIETGEVEVGYLLHKKFWGQGYASEALTALLAWANENINSNEIIGFAPENHIASQRVMEKCGMEYYKTAMGHEVSCCFYRIKNTNQK